MLFDPQRRAFSIKLRDREPKGIQSEQIEETNNSRWNAWRVSGCPIKAGLDCTLSLPASRLRECSTDHAEGLAVSEPLAPFRDFSPSFRKGPCGPPASLRGPVTRRDITVGPDSRTFFRNWTATRSKSRPLSSMLQRMWCCRLLVSTVQSPT